MELIQREKKTRPDDLVRLYETLIQNLTEMASLPGTDTENSKEIAAKILSYKAFRCYYVGLSYAGITKYGEAIALYNLARSKHIPIALTHHQECKNIDKDEIQKLKELDQTIRSQQSQSHAQAFIKPTTPLEQKQKGKEKEKPKDEEKPDTEEPEEERLQPLLAHIDEYKAATSNGKPYIVSFPPEFEAIPCKPLSFDMALNSTQFPSLQNRMKEQKKGFFSSFFGRN